MDIGKWQDPYLQFHFGTENPVKTSVKANAGLKAEWKDEHFDFELNTIMKHQIYQMF